jgi:acyl-CoA reductase-like NAD-dependent aldehyde dehydrogenase
MVSAREHERVLGMIDDAKEDGARLICGGGVPPGLEAGAVHRSHRLRPV